MYLSESQILERRKEISRIARRSSSRIRELEKPGPLKIVKFEKGVMVEAIIKNVPHGEPLPDISHLKTAVQPPAAVCECLHSVESGIRLGDGCAVCDSTKVVVPTVEQADLAQAVSA